MKVRVSRGYPCASLVHFTCENYTDLENKGQWKKYIIDLHMQHQTRNGKLSFSTKPLSLLGKIAFLVFDLKIRERLLGRSTMTLAIVRFIQNDSSEGYYLDGSGIHIFSHFLLL